MITNAYIRFDSPDEFWALVYYFNSLGFRWASGIDNQGKSKGINNRTDFWETHNFLEVYFKKKVFRHPLEIDSRQVPILTLEELRLEYVAYVLIHG